VRASVFQYGVEEWYRAPPGDYARATLNISRTTQNGDGNSRIEANAAVNESIPAWEHLSHSGFFARSFTYDSNESQSISPINSDGVYLQIIYDGIWGPGTTANPSTSRHAIKTGSQIPVSTTAEVDRKTARLTAAPFSSRAIKAMLPRRARDSPACRAALLRRPR